MEAVGGAEGQWIADALERRLTKELWDQSFGTVAATVPDHFEAYARILHRMDTGNGPERRWADIAAARGTVLHPQAQFHRIAQTELYRDAVIDGPHGLQHVSPRQGELDAKQLAALAEILGQFTTSSQDIYQAVWEGWGDFESGEGSIPAAIGEQLVVANGLRRYWVFRGSLDELARPPWFDDGLGLNTQSANLAWPSDRSWCLATEIDFDSTLVGGPADLIAAVVHSETLEALEVTPASDLSSEGDLVNTPPG